MNIASMSQILPFVPSTKAWSYAFLIPTLILKLESPGLTACFRAVKDRETAHKRYRSHPSAETHALYISARNHA